MHHNNIYKCGTSLLISKTYVALSNCFIYLYILCINCIFSFAKVQSCYVNQLCELENIKLKKTHSVVKMYGKMHHCPLSGETTALRKDYI